MISKSNIAPYMNDPAYCNLCRRVTETNEWDCVNCGFSKPSPNMDNFRKGDYGGQCCRATCSNPNAIYHNKSTQRFYCKKCAERINELNKADSKEYYGKPLCEEWVPKQ